MKTHLYNAKLGKVKWFVTRFGAMELLLKPLRILLAPLILFFLKPTVFYFQKNRLTQFYHSYNMTWVSERGVEIPIARFFLDQVDKAAVLEVGNVLSHYGPVTHDVLDKFEKGTGIINQDIVDYHPQKNYALILSISTIEHIGFDDENESNSADKILSALASCKTLLAPGGTLLVTLPIAYNPELDELIRAERLQFNRATFLRRTESRQWVECSQSEALLCRYKSPYPYANAIMVAEFGNN